MKNLKNRLKEIGLLSIVLLLLIANTNQALAQDTIPINLEKILELGGADNLTIQGNRLLNFQQFFSKGII